MLSNSVPQLTFAWQKPCVKPHIVVAKEFNRARERESVQVNMFTLILGNMWVVVCVF